MLLAYPFRFLVPRRTAPEAAVSTAVALLVLAGAADLVPTSVVIALAGGAGATLAGLRLSRLAGHHTSTAPPSGRVVGLLLDVAVVVAGLTAAVQPLVDGGHRAAALVGSLIVASLSVAGVRRLPGRTPAPPPVRLRGLVEATGPAVGLALAGWLLLPRDTLSAPARLVAALLLGGLGMAALSAFTGPGRRSGAAICRGGVLLTVVGLALLVILPPAPAGRAALLAVPSLVVGMLLTALGAGAAVAAVDGEAATDQAAPTWPRAVLPATLLLLAAGLHVGAGRTPDRTSVLLALAAVPPLVLRELLRGGDTGTSERRAAHRRRAGRAVRHRHAAPSERLPSTSTDLGATWPPEDGAGVSTRVAVPWPPAGPAGTSTGVAASWPDTGVAWSAFGHRSASGGGPGDRAILLDALAAIGDVPAPAGALLLVDLHGVDGLGPVAREDVLAEAVLRARAVVASGDLVTGCTGTGFAVVTAAGPVLAYALGIRLLAALTAPYGLAGSVLRAPGEHRVGRAGRCRAGRRAAPGRPGPASGGAARPGPGRVVRRVPGGAVGPPARPGARAARCGGAR